MSKLRCSKCNHYKVNFPEYTYCPMCGRIFCERKSFSGIKVMVDSKVPDDEIHFRDREGNLIQIVRISDLTREER